MRLLSFATKLTLTFAVVVLGSVLAPAQQSDQKPDKKWAAAQLVAAKEKVVNSLKPEDKFYMTTDITVQAFIAGDQVKAGMYAKDLLNQAESMKENWNYGNAIHKAHLVLGRIALAAGDLDEAKAQLLRAGQTPGSPQLDSFGPDMLFAKELLEKGEKDVVIRYFKLCSNFWEMDNGKLAGWTTDVQNDKIPDFGPNVRYVF